jgi:hypothetical protein
MPTSLDPRTDILPQAQRELWDRLAPALELSFVLYGATAVALHLGHRTSIDFDFFRSAPLSKAALETSFGFVRRAQIIQEDINTLVMTVPMPSGGVKVSFFGGLDIGRINEPLPTRDGILIVASLDDLMATKLKAILDRAEARDYRDISAMLSAGVPLDKGLGAFAKMYGKDPGLALRAVGFFKDGDLPTLPEADRNTLRTARDRVSTIPDVPVVHGALAGALGGRDL